MKKLLFINRLARRLKWRGGWPCLGLALVVTNGLGADVVRPPEQEQNLSAVMLQDNITRPLRYSPDGTDFVITNGTEYFNRPLYGSPTAFRIDGGDKPEFALYLPGRGGNLRFGIVTTGGAKWLDEAASVVTRYRPGSLLYEIHDPLLGQQTVQLTVLADFDREGLLVRAEFRGQGEPPGLLWAFGGVDGGRGRREVDIGCEPEPVSKFYQLLPARCQGNEVICEKSSFQVSGKPGTIGGVTFPASRLIIADANRWRAVGELIQPASGATNVPVVLGQVALKTGEPFYVAVQPGLVPAPEVLPELFAKAERERLARARRVVVETPDPFINAAVGALCVAADGVWDTRFGTFMHGAVAWRSPLLGWRGAYAGDALGWHDRTRKHLSRFAAQQNTNAIPVDLPPPDANVNLARSEAALHSNGDLTGTHYDMNLVAVDVFFRHLLWTGDLAYARKMWPVLERHLAWERRLFRREFGTDKLPLYEAYCCIWASDNLQYHGGGVTHSSAYNYYHNRMAARLARLIGQDASPYEQEAGLILQAMRRELWLTKPGWYAEWKDLLGLQLVHPSAGLWTFYHTLDSEVPDAFEAWQMTRFVESQMPRIPIAGPGVPEENNYTLPTTTWMPYLWSLNNVVLAESMHTALGFWQAGRADNAFPLFKGCILDSMFLGLCPGNVGMCTYFDSYRRESQRDFADGVGIMARTLVEGLFGVTPDVLAGELRIRPGFPAEWPRASIRHPDFDFTFVREGLTENFEVEPRFSKPMALRLQVPALRDRVGSVTVNGLAVSWTVVTNSIGTPRVEIFSPAAPAFTVEIRWQGQSPALASVPRMIANGSKLAANFSPARVQAVYDPQQALLETTFKGASVSSVTGAEPGHKTAFVRLEQGGLSWWSPVAWEARPRLEILPGGVQDTDSIKFQIRNNTPERISSPAVVTAGSWSRTIQLDVAAFSDSSEVKLAGADLLPGSTRLRLEWGEGRSASGTVTNWKLRAPAGARFDPIEMAAAGNDSVTRIFKNDYASPRSPYCSLALPQQGIGGWCAWNEQFVVDDTGLRTAAGRLGGHLMLPQGIPLHTPAEASAKNIAFVSQWDNYPRQITLPLQGKAQHAYFLMAGSSNPMQSRFDNGEVVVGYADGSIERLALHNPTTWWPIEQDYYIDDFGFARPEPIPPRVDLRTGTVRVLDTAAFKGKGGMVPGGAATVLDLPLDPSKELKSLTLRALANEVVIGLMSVTLAR